MKRLSGVLAALAVAAAGLVGLAGVSVLASSDQIAADCVTGPTSTGETALTFSIDCSVPLPPAPTVTVTAEPEPTPDPEPTPGPEPTPTTPPATGKPGASNTGVPAGTTLTPYTGGFSTANAVVDGKTIRGPIRVTAKNVTIRNSKIVGGSSGTCVQTADGSGSVILEDVEIVGCENAIGFNNWTARRVNIHSQAGDGVKLGSNVLLEASWIHDLKPGSGAHADGGQVQNGVTNTVVRGNVIDLGSTPRANAALFIAPDLGPTTDGPLLIERNWLNGGNFTVQIVDGNNGRYHIRSITFRDNRFGRTFAYGPWRINVPVANPGNVWDDNGRPL